MNMTGLPMGLMTDEEIAGYGHDRNEAGFGALNTPRGPLPLAAMDVDARVVGVVATIEVAQTFVNTTGDALEATYIFPLPDRAAVHKFQMVVAGRVIDGVIDERGAARAEYDRAIEAGHRAAIAEEERAGVFSLRVGNLMAGEAATVRLSLVGALAVDDGEVTFRFPLVVAPRYMPGQALGGEQAGLGQAFDTTLVPDASRISPPVRLPGCANPVRLGLRVTLQDGVMRDVVASLHAVSERKQDGQVIEAQPGERLDRDFLVRWRIDGAALASTLVCADDADGRAGTFALTVVPPSTRAIAAKPRDVVFVFDRSGSMDGWKMVAARRAVARMVDSLTARDRFAAIAFDNRVEIMANTGLADASDRARFRAVEAIAQVQSRGGTEMEAPMRQAIDMLGGGTLERERMVVLVTDGQVGNEDHLLRELAPGLKAAKVKVFTLGIDQAVNVAFLRRLADLGGGLCELVESEDRLDQVMTKIHQRIGTPIATELAIDAAGIAIDRASVTPRKLPDVYAGAPVVILGRYQGRAKAAAITIEGASLGDPLRETVAATAVPTTGEYWLAAIWARARLRDLEDQYAVQPLDGVEAEIVKTSKQFGVLSRFTAFVAVDRSEVVNAGGRLVQVVQPVEEPAGWAGAKMRSQGPRTQAFVMCGAVGSGGFGGPPAMPRMKTRAGLVTGSAAPPPGAPLMKSSPPGALGPQFSDDSELDFDVAMQVGEPAEPADAGFRRTMVSLADEIAAAARRSDVTGLRVLRQRLAQWIDDARAAGHAAIADAAAVALDRLKQALHAPALDAALVVEVATALGHIGTGEPPKKPQGRRWAFWK
jgi:Ca-activated chloride channel family protein